MSVRGKQGAWHAEQEAGGKERRALSWREVRANFSRAWGQAQVGKPRCPPSATSTADCWLLLPFVLYFWSHFSCFLLFQTSAAVSTYLTIFIRPSHLQATESHSPSGEAPRTCGNGPGSPAVPRPAGIDPPRVSACAPGTASCNVCKTKRRQCITART